MNPLQDALQWATDNYPTASLHHRAAFANSVAYLVSGCSGGFGGPSVREHLVSWSLTGPNGSVDSVEVGGQAMTMLRPDGSLPRPGHWDFEVAVAWCEPIVFGDINGYRQKALQILDREHCFDDDPNDMESLRGKFA